MFARAALLFSLLQLVGCAAFYGPPFDASRFQSAATALDGRVAVFTMKQLIYRPAAGLMAFPDGGIPRYLIDRNYLALFEFGTGRTRVLVAENALRQEWLPGSSAFHVVAAFGPKVIVRTTGQRKQDYATTAATWWYDLESGTRSDLPLAEELAGLGYALGYFYLVDAAGTLVIVADPAGAAPSRRDTVRSLLVRHPDGRYLTIGPMHDYYGLRQGELFYWALEQELVAVDLASGRRRIAERRAANDLSSDPKAGLAESSTLLVEQGSRSTLALGERSTEGWRYTTLPLTVAGVANGE